MTKSTDKIKILNAFTLTEVLITMFVIMLLIIASAPMITKKNIKNKAPHGVWECFLDENGNHVSVKTINGATQPSETRSDYCIFEPQENAKEYTVTVIGGGGGGASGTSFAVDAASYGNSAIYVAEASGKYRVLVIGGGGGGSASINNEGNRGGGAGGVQYKEYAMDKGDMAVLEAGMGGVSGGSVDPDAETADGSSGSTEEEVDETCTGTTWKDVCEGKDGKTSRFYIYGDYSNALEATGGEGGKRSGDAQQGEPKCGNGGKATSFLGGKIFGTSCAYVEDYMNAVKTSDNNVVFGHGGEGSSTADAYPGRNGVVLLISDGHHSGGGGKRGATAFTKIEKITDNVKVYVGQGGAGAIYEDSNGEQGESSAFGYYITAKGGEGGTHRFDSINGLQGLKGEEGAISPYGGTRPAGGSGTCSEEGLNGTNSMGTKDPLEITDDELKTLGRVKAGTDQYGAGGGGGGALSAKDSCGLERKWGKGGRGMPGYVRVEWN